MMRLIFLFLICPYFSWSLVHGPSIAKVRHRRNSPYSFDLTRIESRKAGSEATHSNTLSDTERRQKYLLPVTVEGQTFNLELDTGSSDTWVIQSNFTCYKHGPPDFSVTFKGPQAEDACNFGPSYMPGTGFAQDPDLYLFEAYGNDGDRAIFGPMGEAVVTIGDISVKQLIGAPNSSSFPAYGKSIQSGVMGLGISTLTSAFNALPPDTDTNSLYTPIIETIFETVSLPAQFSLALSRDDSMNGAGGVFTISGLPDNTTAVNITTSEPTTAKLQIFPPYNKTVQSYYSIFIDDYVVDDQSLNTNAQVYIDSGDAYFRVPKATVKAMNSLWDPPPADGDAEDALNCTAVLTSPIGVGIGGRTYYMESRDLIGVDENGICYSLITASYHDTWNVLGDPFLKNVLAVFDWGTNSMQFYPRQYYTS